jgi:NAD-dependent protein deacetylase/lipoamidase
LKPDRTTAIETLVSFLRPAQRMLVVTGAGVSTASGIPDFRGPHGIWKKRQPVFFEDFLASEEKRTEYWDYKSEGYELYQHAQPTQTHRALAELEQTGRLLLLVTQNIDGLHLAAGSSEGKLVEIHGTARSVECLSCDRRQSPEAPIMQFRRSGRAPRCECGGLLKFATISFGQAIPAAVIARVASISRSADMVLALGSTLSVYPAAAIPLEAAERGAPYLIVNRGPTDHDGYATLKIDDDVEAVVPSAIRQLVSG